MAAYYTQDYIDADGQKFRVEWHYDIYSDAPWDNSDLHGEVSELTTRKKMPGELVLCSDDKWSGNRRAVRFYDYQGAIKKARAENWGNWQQGETPQKRGQLLNAAVMSDYKFLRDWCNDDWHYMGIVAFPLTEEGDELRSKSESLWGIESFSDSAYIQEQTECLLGDAGANGQVTEVED